MTFASALFASWLLVAAAMAFSLTLSPFALVPLLAGCAVAVAAVAVRARPAAEPGRHAMLLRYGAVALLALLAMFEEPAEGSHPGYRLAMAMVAVLIVLLLGVHAGGDERTRRRALVAIVTARLVLIALAPLLVPHPAIDVWQMHQYAVDNLVHGRNPYTTPVPDIYQGHSAYGYWQFYPYAPLNLLLSVPAKVLLGDYRHGLTGALIASLWLFRRSLRLLRVPAPMLDLATIAFVLHPRLERLIAYGWTEPYLLLGICAFLYLRLRAPGSPAEIFCLLALPLLKQYFAVPLLLYWVLLRPPLRSVLVAAALAGLAVAPLLAWNLRAAVDHGLLFFVNAVAFRGDSISLAAALAPHVRWRPGAGTALAAQVIAGVLAAWRLRVAARRTDERGGARSANVLASFLLATALSLLASFLVGPVAFVNYYFFAAMVLLLSLGCAVAQEAAAPAWRLPLSHAMRRAAMLLAGMAIIGGPIYTLVFVVGCPTMAGPMRARIARGGAIVDDGFRQAVPGESIFVCSLRHCFGPLCHEDVRCICADPGIDGDALASGLSEAGEGPASCRVDHGDPRSSDATGACRRGRCHEHFPP